MLFASSSGDPLAYRIHSVPETAMSHKVRGLRTKATLMEKPCRGGRRTAFGLVSVAGAEVSPGLFNLKFIALFLEQF